MSESLASLLAHRRALVGVVGLGYVGLPLVQAFAAAGFRTLGFDVDAGKIEKLRAGQSYIGHIPSQQIAELLAVGRFDATALEWASARRGSD